MYSGLTGVRHGTDFATTEIESSDVVPASESDMLSVKYYARIEEQKKLNEELKMLRK